MSVKAISWVWEHSPTRGTDRLVLLALADYAGEGNGHAWPSIARLANKCKIDERTAQRILRRLASSGQIEIVEGGGRHCTNTYTIVMETPIMETPANCRPGSLPGRHPVPETPAPVSPQPLEPSVLPPLPPASGGNPASACKTHKRPRRGCTHCATPAFVVPPWCGGCEAPDRRLVECPDGTVARCPICHPLTAGPSLDDPLVHVPPAVTA